LRNDLTVTATGAINNAGGTVQGVADVYGGIDGPLLLSPEDAKEVVEIPALKAIAHILDNEP
jgi:hypothetical protein